MSYYVIFYVIFLSYSILMSHLIPLIIMLMEELTPSQISNLHLFDLAHRVSTPLSKHYSLAFNTQAIDEDINLPPTSLITHRFCRNCGSIWIPGLTISIRIIYKKKKSSKPSKPSPESSSTRPIRKLQYKCLHCKYKQFDESLIQQPPKKPVAVSTYIPGTTPLDFKATWQGNTNQVKKTESDTNAKSKDRSKKRKQNNLSALLEQKKKQKKQQSGGLNSLNLMEFMQ